MTPEPHAGAGAAATGGGRDSPEIVRRIEDGLPLVDLLARQLRRQLGGKVALDDLVSFGREGLLHAARSFDPTLEVPFRRWANYRVRGAMLDGVRSTSMVPRSIYSRFRAIEAAHHTGEAASEDAAALPPSTLPPQPGERAAEDADARLTAYLAGIATATALGLLATPADPAGGDAVDPAPPADEALARAETMRTVREAIEGLSDQERHLVHRYYFDERQLDEAASELGLSKSWGSRLHARAIEAITRHMKRTRTTL